MTKALVRTRTRRLVGLAALALCATLSAQPARAQQPAASTSGPIVVGTVVDSGTGRPLPYAMVQPQAGGLPTLTDSTGVFRLAGLAPGVHNLTASQLGYSRLTLPVVVGGTMEPVEFKLFPDPIALEGIEVMGDRFRGRRNALPIASQAYNQLRLQRSPALNIMNFLESDAKLSPAVCPGRQQFVGCFNRRGQVVVPEVFLDEAPLMGGLSQLEGYPVNAFYLVEVIGNGLMIRVYTQGFMDRMSKNPRALEPIILK
jgi:hypothetical protein